MYSCYSDLMKSVDPSVDPCKDFYLYACGGWMKKYPRPPSSNRWDQFEKLTTENNEVIEMLLRDKELKAIYSKVGNITYLHVHYSEYFTIGFFSYDDITCIYTANPIFYLLP